MEKIAFIAVPGTRKATKQVKNKKTDKIEFIEYDKEVTRYQFVLKLKTGDVKSKVFGTKKGAFTKLYETVTERPSILSEVGLPDIDKIPVL